MTSSPHTDLRCARPNCGEHHHVARYDHVGTLQDSHCTECRCPAFVAPQAPEAPRPPKCNVMREARNNFDESAFCDLAPGHLGSHQQLLPWQETWPAALHGDAETTPAPTPRCQHKWPTGRLCDEERWHGIHAHPSPRHGVQYHEFLPAPLDSGPRAEPTANLVQVVPNSKRPYLYSGACHACGRTATPESPLIATQPVADSVGITPDTRWCCLHGCLAATPAGPAGPASEPTRGIRGVEDDTWMHAECFCTEDDTCRYHVALRDLATQGRSLAALRTAATTLSERGRFYDGAFRVWPDDIAALRAALTETRPNG